MITPLQIVEYYRQAGLLFPVADNKQTFEEWLGVEIELMRIKLQRSYRSLEMLCDKQVEEAFRNALSFDSRLGIYGSTDRLESIFYSRTPQADLPIARFLK